MNLDITLHSEALYILLSFTVKSSEINNNEPILLQEYMTTTNRQQTGFQKQFGANFESNEHFQSNAKVLSTQMYVSSAQSDNYLCVDHWLLTQFYSE